MNLETARQDIKALTTSLISQPRRIKRALIMLADFLTLFAVVILLTISRLELAEKMTTLEWGTIAAFGVLPMLSVLSFYYLGLYRLVTRHIGRKGLWRIGYSLLAAIMLWALIVFLTNLHRTITLLPRGIIVGYWLAGWAAVWGNRQFVRWWLNGRALDISEVSDQPKKKVMIYGAGDSGMKLLEALNGSGRYEVLGFFDDDKSLWSLKMNGHKIHRFTEFNRLISVGGVSEVFLALPTASKAERRRIIHKLEPYPVKVKTLPRISDLASGKVQVSDIRNIDIEDLLGRDSVPPFDDLMQCNITGKVVMVTGAGGSIGSEIVRQIYHYNPARLVLLELSEFALYRIEQELLERQNERRKALETQNAGEDGEEKAELVAPELVAALGSIGDAAFMRQLIGEHEIDTIYHTAAYKHIPLLEKNPVKAMENNVFATQVLAEAVEKMGVERMVLISSDKAVRPTNVKGASNRLQEVVLQAMAARPGCKTIFTMVRFGNVLDSSGSVVPKFREQIKKGGPVTVTHPEVIRYFMSIREAAQLVIQAGAMAGGGEVYVRDMGEPVKSDELARSMIRLSGKEVADRDNPEGDIEIDYIGLRPGDKMFEEILIEGNVSGTQHPFIMRMEEPFMMGWEQAEAMLALLYQATSKANIIEIRKLLEKYVEGYRPSTMLDADRVGLDADRVGDAKKAGDAPSAAPKTFGAPTPTTRLH